MKFLLMSTCVMFTFNVLAQAQAEPQSISELNQIVDSQEVKEINFSRFFNLAPEGFGKITLSYSALGNSHIEEQFNSTNNYPIMHEIQNRSSYNFQYSYAPSDWAAMGIKVGYETTKALLRGDGSEYGTAISSAGMKNIELNLTLLTQINMGKFLYGIDMSLSPGNRILANVDGSAGNSFTGGHSIAPFIGFEKIIGKSTLGAKFSHMASLGSITEGPLSTTGTTLYNRTKNNAATDFVGFLEFPLMSHVDLGIHVGVGKHDNSNVIKSIDFYDLGFAGSYTFDKYNSVAVGYSMKSIETLNETQPYSEMTVALKRVL